MIKPQGAQKTQGKLLETFFVGPGIIQYFVKPLAFSSGGRSLQIDFTVRSESAEDTLPKGKAFVNFTIIEKEHSFEPDSLVLESINPASKTCAIGPMKILFKNQVKGALQFRYSAALANKPVYEFLKTSGSFNLLVYSKGNITRFEPGKKTMKKTGRISAYLQAN